MGILGNHWGRTHVGTFRAAGCDVVAIVGRDRDRSAAIAAHEGIAGHDLEALRGVDIVVVATPTAQHREHVLRWIDKRVYCEKPLLGAPADPEFVAIAERSSLAVNFAFARLDIAARVHELVAGGRIGHVPRMRLRVDVRHEPVGSALVALREAAIHPLSWLHHAFGPWQLTRHEVAHERVVARLERIDGVIELDVRIGADEGMAIELEAFGDEGTLAMRGGHRPGAGWSFAPVRIDDVDHGDGERLEHGDIWYRANCRAVATYVDWLDGTTSTAAALAAGMFDARRALALEAALAPLLGATR